MQIKKMTKYAIQVIGYIHTKGGSIITSNMIAEEEKIPHGVLMKVLRLLTAEQIVVSHQGRGRICGGFTLNKGLEQITLYDLMRIMGEEVCVKSKEDKESNGESRKMFDELCRIDEVLTDELKKHSLKEVVAGS